MQAQGHASASRHRLITRHGCCAPTIDSVCLKRAIQVRVHNTHRGKIDEQCILMYEAKHLSYSMLTSDAMLRAIRAARAHRGSERTNTSALGPIRFVHFVACLSNFRRIRVGEASDDPVEHGVRHLIT